MSRPPTIMLLSGSMRPNSCSSETCRVAAAMSEAKGAEALSLSVLELDLPMYVPEQEVSAFKHGQDAIHQLLTAYRHADAFLWCSPAYHGSVTGAFKNAIDFAEFLSRDHPPYLQSKPVGIVAINDCTPFAAMRESARELRAWVAPTHVEIPESEFTADRKLTNERSLKRLERLVEELLHHVNGHS